MGDENSQTTQQPETIPYSRFAEVVAKNNQIRDELTAAKAELQKLSERAATADTLAKQLEAAKAEHAKASSTWERQRALMSSGITDDEGIELADYYYSKTPEKDRPPMNDWLKALREDSEKAPKALRPWLTPAQQADAEEQPAAKEAQRPPRTQKAADPAGTRAAKTTVTSDQIKAASELGVKTGNWSEFDRLTGMQAASKKST